MKLLNFSFEMYNNNVNIVIISKKDYETYNIKKKHYQIRGASRAIFERFRMF